jgi:hypothetical protein
MVVWFLFLRVQAGLSYFLFLFSFIVKCCGETSYGLFVYPFYSWEAVYLHFTLSSILCPLHENNYIIPRAQSYLSQQWLPIVRHCSRKFAFKTMQEFIFFALSLKSLLVLPFLLLSCLVEELPPIDAVCMKIRQVLRLLDIQRTPRMIQRSCRALLVGSPCLFWQGYHLDTSFVEF